MTWIKNRLSKRVGTLILVVGLLVVSTVVSTALAQEQGQSPFALINQKLDAILGPFALINQKLDAILHLLTPDTPVAGPVTLSTGYARVHSTDLVICALANVGTAVIPLVTDRILDVTGVAVGSGSATNVQPGAGAGGGIGGNAGSLRCEFSFVGFANSVRATMIVESAGAASQVVLDAR